MEWHGHLSFLKGGLRFADVVTTVSATHADEIRSDVGGFGLHESFRGLGDRLVGIRNGIDQEQWDPSADKLIAARYSVADLAPKARCKEELQLACRLPRADVPLFAMSARMVRQKGIDLILASRAVRDLRAQFVFMGQGEAGYESGLAALAAEMPQRIATRTTFCDRFERRLISGADFLLMPSLYEPCGLTQMRAQRYGTLPVARRTGGLAETIADGRTGFLFDDFSVESFDDAIARAAAIHARPGELRERMALAMEADFSWSRPLAEYDEVYRRAMAAR
jgi:starch synthase